MSQEQTDTNDNYPDKDIPDGSYDFKVLGVKKKYGGQNKDKPFYIWSLEYEGVKGEQVLMPSTMGGLLSALGCQESKPGVYEWDTELMVNQIFSATVTHVKDKKDPSKIRQQMTDFKKVQEEAPF